MIAMRTAFHGWRVVGAAFIVAMFFGLLRGLAAAPSAALLFAAATLIQLDAAAAAILLGRERLPGARPALAGLAD